MVRLLGVFAALALLCSCSAVDDFVDDLSTPWEKEKTSYGSSVVANVKYRTANDGKVPLLMDKYFERDSPDRDYGSYTSNILVAGYDKDNRYMVICFGQGPKILFRDQPCYHYCRFPASVWRDYKSENNKDAFYAQKIKGKFDCRIGNGSDVPTY